MKTIYKLLFIFTCFTITNAHAQTPKEKGLAAIDEATINSTLTHLASDWMEGREAGRPGAYRAAEYIASLFEFMGLEPAGDIINGKPTFFQSFDVLEYKAAKKQSLSITSAGQEYSFAYHTDFEVKAAPTSIKGKGDLVFVGYGLAVDSLNYDDFAKQSVKGKIWVRLKGAPTKGELGKSFKELPAKQLHLLKSKLAEEMGALAVIEIDPNSALPKQSSNFPFRDNRKYYEGDEPLSSFYETQLYSPINKVSKIAPVFMGGAYLMASLLDQKDLETYHNALQSGKASQITLKAEKAAFKANSEVERKRVRNVLAKITGEEEPDSVVMVGAHYDHLGKRDGYVWNGADDNASGVAAILGIAKAAKATGVKPKKTILFASWTAEEKGLHGSKHFLRTYEQKENINVYLNFDMIGRRGDWHSKDNQVSFIYTAEMASIWDKNERNIADFNINLEMFDGKTKMGEAGGSDNVNFDKEGIPYFWYHTGGHEDYHQVSDHSDKIMMDKAAEITKLSYLNIWDLANE